MKSSKSLEKEELYGRLLDSIDEKLSEGFKKPIITFDFYGDESEIPQPNDGYVRWVVVSKIPEPRPLPEEFKKQ